MSARTRRGTYVVGLVNGEVLVQTAADAQPECCEDCGAGYHPGMRCRQLGTRSDPHEGHRGDE